MTEVTIGANRRKHKKSDLHTPEDLTINSAGTALDLSKVEPQVPTVKENRSRVAKHDLWEGRASVLLGCGGEKNASDIFTCHVMNWQVSKVAVPL